MLHIDLMPIITNSFYNYSQKSYNNIFLLSINYSKVILPLRKFSMEIIDYLNQHSSMISSLLCIFHNPYLFITENSDSLYNFDWKKHLELFRYALEQSKVNYLSIVH